MLSVHEEAGDEAHVTPTHEPPLAELLVAELLDPLDAEPLVTELLEDAEFPPALVLETTPDALLVPPAPPALLEVPSPEEHPIAAVVPTKAINRLPFTKLIIGGCVAESRSA